MGGYLTNNVYKSKSIIIYNPRLQNTSKVVDPKLYEFATNIARTPFQININLLIYLLESRQNKNSLMSPDELKDFDKKKIQVS